MTAGPTDLDGPSLDGPSRPASSDEGAVPLGVGFVRAFADNYIWLIEPPGRAGLVVAVDPGDADPVLAELDRRGSSLAAILLTHHHQDHIGGVERLLRRCGPLPVIGPEDARSALRNRTVKGGDRCELPELGLGFETLDIPGHTVSHIAFFGHGALFCGDTLFSAGCGRMFEGTPEQMIASLERLRALPPDTRVYCGHEYTASNLRFAAAVDPSNAELAAYRERVQRLQAGDGGGPPTPTLPSALSLEIRVNPFLRCDTATLRTVAEWHAGRPLATPAEVFGVLRAWKDGFK